MNTAFEITKTVEPSTKRRVDVNETMIPTISVDDFTIAVTESSYVARVREIVSLYEIHHKTCGGHFGSDYMTLDQRRFQISISYVMTAIAKYKRDDLARAIVEGDVFSPCFLTTLFRDWIVNKKIELILLYARNHARLHADYKAYALADFEQVFAWYCDPDLLRELCRRDRESMLCFTALIGHLIFTEHRELIFFLLDQGFDVEATFLHGGQWLTPLEFVVYHCVSGRKQLIDALVARGANPRHLNRFCRYVSPTLPININLATVAFSSRDAEGIIALAKHGVHVTSEDIALFEEANGEEHTLMIGGWFMLHGRKEVLKYLPSEYKDRVLTRERGLGRRPCV
jgi:hypothetical protein